MDKKKRYNFTLKPVTRLRLKQMAKFADRSASSYIDHLVTKEWTLLVTHGDIQWSTEQEAKHDSI